MSTQSLEEICKLASLLEAEQKRFVPKWQLVSKWVAPWRGRSLQGFVEGDFIFDGENSENKHILDATATRSLRVLAAGLQSGLTSPARPWFRLRKNTETARESGLERRWLDTVEEALYSAFSGSNFYQAVHGLYMELAVFGSACMYVEADPENLVRFATLNCGEFSWAANASGRVDTVLRLMHMSPRQMAELWGEEKLSARTQKLLTQKPDAHCEVYHLVRPRKNRDPRRLDKENMPFASYVWEKGGKTEGFLHVGGFEEFPFLCARWDVQGGDLYGHSPAMETLPDIRMLQEMTKSQLLAIHKVVNPPMRVPASYKQRLSLIPGAVNYVNQNSHETIAPLYQISPDLRALSQKISEVREAVRQGFFHDLFLMFAGDSRSNVTATEVMERGQEKLLMLGPVIERHQTEILNPLLARVFGLVERSGLVEEAPESMGGELLRVEYVSNLAQAQRLGSAEAIKQLTAEVASLASVCPEVLDKIDFDQAVDELAMIAGVSSRIVRSDAEVEDLRTQRAEQAQMQEQAQRQMQAVNDILGTVGGSLGAGLDGEPSSLGVELENKAPVLEEILAEISPFLDEEALQALSLVQGNWSKEENTDAK